MQEPVSVLAYIRLKTPPDLSVVMETWHHGLACSARVVNQRVGTYYEWRSVWIWHCHLPAPVLIWNLRGLLSRTDLMSLLAAAEDPDILKVGWKNNG